MDQYVFFGWMVCALGSSPQGIYCLTGPAVLEDEETLAQQARGRAKNGTATMCAEAALCGLTPAVPVFAATVDGGVYVHVLAAVAVAGGTTTPGGKAAQVDIRLTLG